MSSRGEMAGKKMDRRPKFTIYHGFAASLALHSAVALPFTLYAFAAPPEEPPTLVVELQGVVAESQSEEKVLQETKGEAKQDKPDVAKPAQARAATTAPPDDPPPDVTEDGKEASTPPPAAAPSPPASEAQSGSAGANDISGIEARQNAQTIKTDRDEEIDRLNRYVKLLTKKVMVNLVYPDEGRQARLQGAATVSFTILQSGQIRPESLKILASTGQPKLDASALKTVRSSAPFDPPPKEMTVAIAVAFGRKP
jgi:protein TonB